MHPLNYLPRPGPTFFAAVCLLGQVLCAAAGDPWAAKPCEVQSNASKACCEACGADCKCKTRGCEAAKSVKASAPVAPCQKCGSTCDCAARLGGCGCEATEREKAATVGMKSRPQTTRLDSILAMPVMHRSSDGTLTRMSLKESVARGGALWPETITAYGISPEEVEAIHDLYLPRPATDGGKWVYRPAASPIVPQQAAPAYYVAPIRQTPPGYVAMPGTTWQGSAPPGTSRPGFSTGFQFNGPLGGGFQAGACVGGT
jgi:hypothetical protein